MKQSKEKLNPIPRIRIPLASRGDLLSLPRCYAVTMYISAGRMLRGSSRRCRRSGEETPAETPRRGRLLRVGRNEGLRMARGANSYALKSA